MFFRAFLERPPRRRCPFFPRRFFHPSLFSSFRSRFFCRIAMYIFSVQSRPALMLPKHFSPYLRSFTRPLTSEGVSFKKCIIIFTEYIYITFCRRLARTIERRIKYFSEQPLSLPLLLLRSSSSQSSVLSLTVVSSRYNLLFHSAFLSSRSPLLTSL